MSATSDSIVIVAARRTPIGAFQGRLTALSAPQLGAAVIKAALAEAGVAPEDVGETLMGCVLPAGVGQAPARQAALGAGLPVSAPATTVNKICGSGMKAAMLGHDMIRAGSAAVVVAGGMESMTNAPYLLPKHRQGQRLGHGEIVDHMFRDGLEDAYEGYLMGHYADLAAVRAQVTRAAQDAYAAESVRRAQAAVAEGRFAAEIAAVEVAGRKSRDRVAEDETPGQRRSEGLEGLKPAFSKDGTVTAGNASTISDGAAALIMMRESGAQARGLRPLARLVAHATVAGPPGDYPFAPVAAVRNLLAETGWKLADVDLLEINEAFAVVALIALQELGLDHARLNVNGGACALGHPIGATGARILVTLIHALRARGLRRGIATLCIGGGEATAVAIETL